MVNEDIAHLVAQEMKKTSDLSVVAQNVVEKVKSLFCTSCRDGRRSGRLDDITLVVRNLGYPTPIPHTHSYPGNLHSMPSMTHQVPSGTAMGGGGHQALLQDHQQSGRVLHSVMSYPSHMHNQPSMQHVSVHSSQQYGSPYYQPSGGPVHGDPRDYSVSQPHMSLQSGGVSGNVMPSDPTFYSMGPGTRTYYSGLQGADTQNRHPQATFDGGRHSQEFYNQGPVPGAGAGGGYPSNYQNQHQPLRGQSAPGQQPQPHPPVRHAMSDPQKLPPHPLYSQRLSSLQETHVTTSPEHGALRHEYENIPNRGLNPIAESKPQSSSSTKHSDAVYENVTLHQQQTTLQPGSGSDTLTKRYSDSLLAEKTHDMSLKEQPSGGVVTGSGVSPVRPHSAEPPRQTANDSFTSISALPSMQTGSVEDEDFLLYGWKKEGGDDSSSMSTLTQGTLSSSDVLSMPSMGGVSHAPSMPEAEAKTPVNGEVRQLGSITKEPPPPPAQSQSTESAKEEEELGEDEEMFTADMSDFSEASEAEPDEEIDAESGEIRSYIKNWGKFPFHLSWEEV